MWTESPQKVCDKSAVRREDSDSNSDSDGWLVGWLLTNAGTTDILRTVTILASTYFVPHPDDVPR